MILCYRALDLEAEAANCYQKLVENSRDNPYDQHQMMLLCKEFDISILERPVSGKASPTATSLGFKWTGKGRAQRQNSEKQVAVSSPFTVIAPRPPRLTAKPAVSDRLMNEKVKEENSVLLFARLRLLVQEARNGNFESRFQWIGVAKTLIQDFRSERAFFSGDKQSKFSGLSRETHKKTLTSKIEQTSKNIDVTGKNPCSQGQPIPTCGISMLMSNENSVERDLSDNERLSDKFRATSFETWLDVFLEYALMLALENDIEGAYKTISVALSANVFHCSPDYLFLIHVCWFSR